MKQAVNLYEFKQAFADYGRKDNFSYDGLEVLFNYLQDYEESTCTEIDLDVIAICCDYTESTIQEALESNGLNSIEELVEYTMVIPVDNDRIIYQNY